MDENVNLFEITVAGRLFTVARELDDCNQFHQAYYVDGDRVPVQHYLQLLAVTCGPSRPPDGGRTTSAKS